MAYFDYGLNLELKNFQAFIDGAKNIDQTLDKLANSILSTASALDKVDGAGIKGKATALSSISLAYKKLGEATAAIDPNSIINVNKAISSGAQVKTIEGKAEAMEAFAKQAQKLAKLPDLSASATQIATILTAFAGFGGSLANFKDVDGIAGAIGKLASAFKRMEKVTLADSTVQSVKDIITIFTNLGALSTNANRFDELTTKFSDLFKAVRAVSTGAGAKELPGILTQITTVITTLIDKLSEINKNSSFGGDKIIAQIREIAIAFRDLGIAIRSYGGVKSSGFDNVETNINKALAAFNTLVKAFQNTTFADDISKSIVPATQALSALGGAFESLGRKKGFEKFPDTIDLINKAITQLNIKGLDELAIKIQYAVPALQQLAEVAKAITTINNQAGRSFFAAAKEKEKDTESTLGLGRSYQVLSSIINQIIPTIVSFSGTVKNVAVFLFNLIEPTKQLGIFLLQLPFNIVSAGFRGLAAAIAAPFNLLVSVGQIFLQVVHYLHLMQLGLQTILFPFKALYAALNAIISIASNVSAGFTKVISSITGFGKSTTVAATDITNFTKVEDSAIIKTQELATTVQSSGDKVAKSGGLFSKLSYDIIGTFSAFNRGAESTKKYSDNVNKVASTSTQASHGVQNFSNSVADSNGNIETAINKLGALQVRIASVQKVAGLAEELFNGLKESLVGSAESAFDAAAKFEQLQVSLNILAAREFMKENPGQFDTVLGAVDSVKDSVNETIERFEMLAITSPFTSEDIASGYQLAQIYGFTGEEAENLTNILVDANSAIGASGANIASIVLPLGQIKQLGKATLVDLKQVATAAKMPVFEVLQKEIEAATGAAVPMADVMDLISNGMISADFAINAITKSLKNDFNGAAAASTNTFEGLRSTLSDLRQNTLRQFATPIFKAILFGQNEGDFALAGLLSLEKIKEQLESAKKSGEEFATKINAVFQAVAKAAQYVQAAFALIPQPIIEAAKVLGTFLASTAAATVAILVVGLGLFELIVVIGSFVSVQILAVAAVVGLASTIISNYGAIKEAVLGVGESFTQIPEFINQSVIAIQNFMSTGSVIGDPFSQFTGILQVFGNTILTIVGYVTQFSQAFSQAFTTLISTGTASISVFSGLPSVLRVVGEEIFKVLNTFASWGSAIATFPVTIGGVASSISEIFSKMLGEFVDWGSNIIIAFSQGIDNTVNLLSQAIQAIGGILTFWLAPGSPPKVAPDIDKWGELAALEFVDGFTSSFISGLNTAGTLIQSNFSTVITGIGSAILNPLAAIGRVAVVLIGGTIVNAFAAILTVGNGIFEIVSSLFNGLSQQIGIIIVTIIRIVEALAKPTKAFVTLTNVVQAFADGAKLTLGNFANTISGVFRGLLQVFGGVVAFINGQLLVGFLALGQVSGTIGASLGEIGRGSRDFLGGVQTALQAADNYFRQTLDNVTDYGSNIVQQFADGMLGAVSAVANALAEIGRQITYWLEPGSPPRLLPDIDDWGTAAANEFVGAFSQADLTSIGDFGDTITQLLTSVGADGIDSQAIVEQFASGLLEGQQTGTFGAMNFQQIGVLAGDAAPEVLSLTEKFAQFALEQSRLAEVTRQYDAELKNVQGSLDEINNQQGIEQNQQKIESLSNALSNTLLTQNERTRIQQQIQRLQAEKRVKQLEAEKKAVESNAFSTAEQIALQKQQLQLADKFGTKGTIATIGAITSMASGLSNAVKEQDRLSDAVLKYKLQTADTAGKIAIMKEELAKVQVGSKEYYDILTEISQLESQLAREREQAAKADKMGKKEGLADAYGSALTGGGGLSALSESTAKVQETIDKTKEKFGELQTQVSEKFKQIKESITGTWTTIKGYLDAWLLKNDTVKASIVAIGVVIAGTKLIGGISALGSTLTLLSNPLVAIGAGIVAVSAAFAFFAIKAGGVNELITDLKNKFFLFFDAIRIGFTFGKVDMGFDGITNSIITIGTILGSGAKSIIDSFRNFFVNIGTNVGLFISGIATYVSTSWTNFQNGFITTLSDLNILDTKLGIIAVGIVTSLFDYFITPISEAFSNNETILGKLTAGFLAFYDGIVQLSIDTFNNLREFFANQKAGNQIEKFFTDTFVGTELEANINEAVGNIVPSLENTFDLSTFVTTIVSQFRTLYDAVLAGAQNLYDAIIVPIINTFNTVKEALSGVIAQNSAAFSEFFSEIASPEFVSGLANIAQALGVIVGAIAAVAAAIIDAALIGILKNIADVVIEVGAGIDTLKLAFSKFAEGDILGGIAASFQGLSQIFDGIFGNIADAIADTIKALLEFVGIDTSGTLGIMIQFFSDLVVQIFSFNKIFTIFGGLWRAVLFIFEKAMLIIPTIIALFTSGGGGISIWTKALFFLQSQFNKVIALFVNAPGVFFALGKALMNIPAEIINVFESIDLSQAAALFKGLIEGVFGFDTETIVANLTTKLSTTIDSAIAGITAIAFNISDAIVISEDEEQFIATKIKKFLPDLSTIFGDGTNEKVALKLADYITINEAEVTAIKDTLTGVVDVLSKFVNILPLPQTFKDGLQGILDLFTGKLSLGDALTNVYNTFVNIGIALATAFANPFETVKGAIDGLSNPITIVSEGFISLKETIAGLLEIDLSGFTSIFAPVTEAFTAIGQQLENFKSGLSVLNAIPGVNIRDTEVTGADVARESIRNEIETKLADSPFSVETKIDLVTGEEDLALQSKKLIATFTESYAENTTFGITNFAKINRDLIEGGFTATDISALSEKFGLEVPAGLALGLQDTNGDLDRATTGLATNLLSQISEDLGIQSPSTKARDDIGIPFVQGIALGLEDYTAITTALGVITTSMISTVTTALSEASLKINVAQSLFTLNEAVVQVTRLALENISNLHIETFGKISDETIPNFVSLTEEQFTNSFDTILGLLEEFAEEMITTIEDLSTDVIDLLGTMRNKIANLTSGFKNVGKDLGEALMEGIINAIEDQTDSVIGAVNALFGADGVESTTLLDKSKASGVKIGKAFTEGVAEGILAPTALAAIKQAVEEMIQQAEDAAKKAAGVESPSTLFRDSIGKNLTAGIGIGMMDGLDGLTDITKNIINSIYLLTKDEIGSQFTTGITDGIQSQQTALNTTVTNLLDNSVLAAKTQLQINSPSRVTNKSIGVPYVDGILTALEGGRGRLSNVAGSLLDVLPLNQTFKYNVEGQVAKQPVELQYSNLMTALPQLTQNVALQSNSYQRSLGNAAVALSGRNTVMSNTNMESVNTMTDSRSTSLSNYTVNNYEMTVMTTPERATRVEHNFDAMRLRRRI